MEAEKPVKRYKMTANRYDSRHPVVEDEVDFKHFYCNMAMPTKVENMFAWGPGRGDNSISSPWSRLESADVFSILSLTLFWVIRIDIC